MANLLPNHTGTIINAITEDSGMRIKTKVDEIKSSMDEVYNVMVKMGLSSKRKFLKESVVYAERRVLITLLKSVKILKVCCKQ